MKLREIPDRSLLDVLVDYLRYKQALLLLDNCEHLISACASLAQRGETAGFFGPVIPAGSHQTALQMLLAGQIDATAIDSTVLEVELDIMPSIAGQIRIISTWGPSPLPPWVIQKKLPAEMKSAIQKELLRMEVVAEGKDVLASLGLRRFAQVSDRDYNLIRDIFHKARAVQL